MTTSRCRTLVRATLVSAVSIVIGLALAESSARGPEVAAVVEGVAVRMSDIAVSEEEAGFRFRMAKGREPRTSEDERHVEALRADLALRHLAARIRSIVFEKQRHRLGIVVTDAEVSEKWRSLTRGLDLSKAIEQQRASLGPLLSALTAVYEKGEDKNVAYEKHLAGRMTPTEWEVQLRYYRTANRRKILVDAVKQTPDDLRKPDPGVRPMLIQEKMNDAIDSEIAREDAEFREYKRLIAAKSPAEMLQRFGRNYLGAKRDAWWRDRYREADIAIVDGRFKAVLGLLLGDSASPSPSTN